MEHRWGRRIPVRVPVRLVAESGEPVAGRLENVSVSGAFVRTAQLVPLWARLEVEVLPAGEPGEKPERVAGHVVRRTPHGIGIEWYELAPHAVRTMLHRVAPCRRMHAPHERPLLQARCRVALE